MRESFKISLNASFLSNLYRFTRESNYLNIFVVRPYLINFVHLEKGGYLNYSETFIKIKA